jgi:hypothetical protein
MTVSDAGTDGLDRSAQPMTMNRATVATASRDAALCGERIAVLCQMSILAPVEQ